MNLRPALPEDAEALAKLGRDSFVAAFAHLYDPADLDAFLAAHKTPASYRRAIEDPSRRICLAEEGGRLVGFCIVRRPSEFAEHSDALRPISLQQLYCAPGEAGKGIGARLIDWALAEARALEADAVQLSVWAGNHGAQRFYARHGFAKIADIDFYVGSQRDDEFLLERRLT